MASYTNDRRRVVTFGISVSWKVGVRGVSFSLGLLKVRFVCTVHVVFMLKPFFCLSVGIIGIISVIVSPESTWFAKDSLFVTLYLGRGE